MDTSIATDKMMSTIEQSIPLLREEVLQAQPNKQVFRFEPNARSSVAVAEPDCDLACIAMALSAIVKPN
jgi:hypothetical protein